MNTIAFNRPDGKKLNIEIIKYRSDDENRDTPPDRHRYEFHAIFFIQSGSSKREIDFEDYEIQKGQVMIIPKGSTHWEKANHTYSGYVILFNESFFSEVQTQLLNALLLYAMALRKLLIPIDSKDMPVIEQYFELLYNEQADADNQNQTFILQNLMLALINKLEGIVQKLPEENSFINVRRPFQRFIELVEKHYHLQHQLDFYTSSLQLTTRKLNEVVKKLTGLTAHNFLIDRIIIEAKRELCFKEKSIKEIAFDLGYESPYYFSRIFKKRVGLNPEQFRSQFAE